MSCMIVGIWMQDAVSFLKECEAVYFIFFKPPEIHTTIHPQAIYPAQLICIMVSYNTRGSHSSLTSNIGRIEASQHCFA